MSRKKAEPNSEEVFLVAKYFFDGKKAREIKEQVNKELKLPKPLSREGVYPLLAEARRLNYIRLIPPLEEELARLKSQVEKAGASKPWWERIAGTFQDDPVYAKAMKLGRQYRRSQRNRPGR